jgi:hypothetical protein
MSAEAIPCEAADDGTEQWQQDADFQPWEMKFADHA